jgi:hypothetical protein
MSSLVVAVSAAIITTRATVMATVSVSVTGIAVAGQATVEAGPL